MTNIMMKYRHGMIVETTKVETQDAVHQHRMI